MLFDSQPGRRALALALCGILVLAGFPASASDRHVLELKLARVRELSAILRQPVLWNEAHPALRFLSPLAGMQAEPHLSAIKQLVNTEMPAAALPIIDVLADPDFPYRQDAAIALARLQHPASLDVLIDTMDDPDWQLRRVAARALGVVGSTTVERDVPIDVTIRRLNESLAQDPEPMVRVAALSALIQLGTPEALDIAFTTASNDSDPLVKCGLLPAAAYFALRGHTKQAIHSGRQVLWSGMDRDRAPESRGVLTRAYYRNSTHSPVILNSDCVDVNEVALGQLAIIHFRAVLPVLEHAAAAPDAGLRGTAVKGVAEFSDESAFQVLVEALRDPIWGVRREAIDGLRRSRDLRSYRHLAETLLSGGQMDRREAARSLEDPSDPNELVMAFGDPVVQVREAAEKALAIRERIIEELRDELEAVIREGSSTMGRTVAGNRRPELEGKLSIWRKERLASERALVAALGHEDRLIRVRSATVIARYRTETSFELLIDVLRSGPDLQAETAALALGLRGDERARTGLEARAVSKDASVAVASIRALQDLELHESLPTLREIEATARDESVVAAADNAIAMLSLRSGVM